MLCVKTRLGESAIEGVGLFAAEAIPKGTVVWRYDPRFDLKLDMRDIPSSDTITREWLMRYGYQPNDEPVYIVCGDNARFMNHSDQPNCDDVEELTIAMVDIAEGEEITCDYARFDKRFAEHRFAVGWA
jgi:SET domain-containing protein